MEDGTLEEAATGQVLLVKDYNDCVHWCLPGPIDVWNEFLMAILEKEAALISS